MTPEFACTCSPYTMRCVGCRANEAIAAAVAAERKRCAEIAARLQRNASCKTVQRTCQAIIDRILEVK